MKNETGCEGSTMGAWSSSPLGTSEKGTELAALVPHQRLKFPAGLVAPRLPCGRVLRGSGLEVEGAAQSRKG